MKKSKLTLKNIKVQSFVTDMKNEDSQTVKGGTGFPETFAANCETSPIICFFASNGAGGCDPVESVFIAC